MKKIFALLVTLTSLQSYGQIEKGQVMFNGSVYGSYQYQENDYEGNSSTANTYSFVFRPHVGYFVLDNLSLGVVPQFGISKSKMKSSISNDQESKSKGYGLSVAIDKYMGSGKLLPFIGVSCGLNKSIREYYIYNIYINGVVSASEIKEKYLYSNLSLKGGLAYFVNEKVSINLILAYDYLIYDYKVNSIESWKGKTHHIYFGSGISVFL
ncbi:MAG: hypothetical protein K9H64_08550 [Bacteroidales bacterium]|nr:hypothetical protein [Bacteroidales bacterium]MCF8455881.1 hypothetical protein [Bacteroidales bacterium]